MQEKTSATKTNLLLFSLLFSNPSNNMPIMLFSTEFWIKINKIIDQLPPKAAVSSMSQRWWTQPADLSGQSRQHFKISNSRWLSSDHTQPIVVRSRPVDQYAQYWKSCPLILEILAERWAKGMAKGDELGKDETSLGRGSHFEF